MATTDQAKVCTVFYTERQMRISLFLVRERLRLLPSLIRSADGWSADHAAALRLEQQECRRMQGMISTSLLLLEDEVRNGAR